MSERVYNYPKFVEKKTINMIEDIKTNRRLQLDITIKNETCDGPENLVVIMMNPSKANRNQSDKTINNVLKYVHMNLKSIRKISFFNLYVFYETSSINLPDFINLKGELFSYGNDISPSNDDLLRKGIDNSSVIVIIAWGKPVSKPINYDIRTKSIMNIIKKNTIYHIGSFTNDGYPRHARNWVIEDKHTLNRSF